MRFSGIERCFATLVFMRKCKESVNNKGVQIIAIVARFPSLIERIPCSFVINKRINVEHLTHPIVGTIYVGISIIDEGTHLPHNVIPSGLHFRGDSEHGDGHD